VKDIYILISVSCLFGRIVTHLLVRKGLYLVCIVIVLNLLSAVSYDAPNNVE